MFNDNKDFYPTPHVVLDSIGIDCKNKIVLEPSAGKGDIIDWLKNNGVKEVLSCEQDTFLAEIVKTKSRYIGNDFLAITSYDISHIHMIVMNPPFSSDVDHILHAWDISPAGCEIIALCNYSTLDNDYSYKRKQLLTTIKNYGNSEELGNVFEDAERKTGVNVGLVRLYKPGVSDNEFNGFFMEEEEEHQENGIMRFDMVRDVVQRYVGAVKCFEEHAIINTKMNSLTEPFKVGQFGFTIGYDNIVHTKDDFAKGLQKEAWKYLFNLMNLNKFVTSGVMRDINKFVEDQQKIPFTMKNIYKMFDIIIGTREQTFNKSLVEAIDKFTQHTHENRYNLEGWKTNSGYMLNKKFIVDYMVEKGWGNSANQMRLKSSNNSDKLKDLTKVLCSLSGINYDNIIDLHYHFSDRHRLYDGVKLIGSFRDDDSGQRSLQENINSLRAKGIHPVHEIMENEFGKWMSWGFFEVKGYMKGTLHIKFKDDKVWELINRQYAKIKGQVLPEKI